MNPVGAVREFLDAGGPVLYALLGVAALLWTLIIERWLYFRREWPGLLAALEARWQARADRASWHARQLKRRWLSETRRSLRQGLPLIRMLVAVCPMIGLLGTVSGMIQVFEVMAALGTGNARAMASGITAATLPTMAGMVVAISGLYFVSRFDQWVEQAEHRLDDHLTTH
jgi:biopolymer transport protein ExbB